MSKYRYGLKTFEVSDIDAAGAIVADTTVDLIANVYKESVEITEAESSTTKHYAEGFNIPAIVLKEAGEKIAKVALFNYDYSVLEKLKGGVATSFNGKSKYVDSITQVTVEKHIRFVTIDDVEIIIKRSFVDAVEGKKLNSKDVGMLNMIMMPLIPNDGSGEAFIEQEVGFVSE